MLPYVPRPLSTKTENKHITNLQETVATSELSPVEENKEVGWESCYKLIKNNLRQSNDIKKRPFVYLHSPSDAYYLDLISQKLQKKRQGYIQYILDFHENSNVLFGILLGIIQTDFIVFFITDAYFDDPLCHFALTTSLQDKKKIVIFIILKPLQQNRNDILQRILKLIKRSQKNIYHCIPNIMMMDWTERARLKDLMDIISSPIKKYDNCTTKGLRKYKLSSLIQVRLKQLNLFIQGNLEGQLFKRSNKSSEIGPCFETTLHSRPKRTSNFDSNSLLELTKGNISTLEIQNCPIKFCSKKIFHPQNCFFDKHLIIPKTLSTRVLQKWKPGVSLTPEQILSDQEVDEDDSLRDEIIKRMSRVNYFCKQERKSSNCSQAESYIEELLKMCCLKGEQTTEIEEIDVISYECQEIPKTRNDVEKKKTYISDPVCNYIGRLAFLQKLRQKKVLKID